MLPTLNPSVTIDAFGAADTLHFHHDLPRPICGDGEILIDNHFAGVNPIDCKTRAGLGWGAEKIADHLPAVLGFDFAGVVIESKDERFTPGMRVCALSFAGGGYARFATLDANLVASVPQNVTLEQAGALPCAGATAWQLLEQADIPSGAHVVMNAPAGGVGHIALQLLAAKDVRISLITSSEKYSYIQKFAPIQQWIDYRTTSSFPCLEADLLLDLVGGNAGIAALNVLREGGRAICLPSIHVPLLQAAGVNRGIQVDGFVVRPDASTLNHLLTLINEQQLTIHITHGYPLSEAAQAHHAQESGRTFGKLILATQS